jgi:hypothetical protein
VVWKVLSDILWVGVLDIEGIAVQSRQKSTCSVKAVVSLSWKYEDNQLPTQSYMSMLV